MQSEPNVRVLERAFTGRPYGYGSIVIKPPIRPLAADGSLFDPGFGKPVGAAQFQPPGESLNADSRPQLIQSDRAPGGHGRKDAGRTHPLGTDAEVCEMKPTYARALASRPQGTQQAWNAHVARMRRRRALRGFVKLCVIPVVVLGLLIVGATPLAFGWTRSATRAEGEQLLGSARDKFRVEYSRTKSVQAARAAFVAALEQKNFEGQYYRVIEEVRELPNGVSN